MAFVALPLPSGLLVDEHGVTRLVNRTYLNATAIGNTQLVAAQGALTRVRVLGVFANTNTVGLTIHFQSAATRISSDKYPATTGGWVQSSNDHGWFQTAFNEALNINLSGAGLVGIDVIWVQAAGL